MSSVIALIIYIGIIYLLCGFMVTAAVDSSDDAVLGIMFIWPILAIYATIRGLIWVAKNLGGSINTALKEFVS
jgi:hypothetical protein